VGSIFLLEEPNRRAYLISREDKRSIEPSDKVRRSRTKEEAICKLIRPTEREWRLDRKEEPISRTGSGGLPERTNNQIITEE